ncbi:hypothetical protein QAD02_022299 [Eretmocerus hayati]|uniref:Uncharacterized protein n=1 Tax=Eretmocerus hayati TaxID=131215 RepID=A0ACC2PXH4_9HYME|nr:hypothetical protein QAD02_022299 [Eretmocerus hayati]
MEKQYCYCAVALCSVGSIEASIPSGLCSGSLGADDEADPEVDDHHQQQSDPSLGGLRLQDLHSPADDDASASAQQQQAQVQQIQLNGVQGSVQGQLVGEFGTSFWVDDMAGFPLPPLDLDPLPPGLFSPCSATYNWGCARGDCMPRAGNINGEGMADVLLSLKHAVVHPGSPTGAGYYTTGSAPAHHAYASAQDYGQSFGPGTATVTANHYPQGPAMSVNVSMNMTMNMNMHPG